MKSRHFGRPFNPSLWLVLPDILHDCFESLLPQDVDTALILTQLRLFSVTVITDMRNAYLQVMKQQTIVVKSNPKQMAWM